MLLLPVGMNYRTERLPLVTLSLIATTRWSGSFPSVSISARRPIRLWIMGHLWLIPAQSFFWTYFTSMFVHAGIFHLLGNMFSSSCSAHAWRTSSGAGDFRLLSCRGIGGGIGLCRDDSGSFCVHGSDGRRIRRHQRVHGHVSTAARGRGYRIQIFRLVFFVYMRAGEFEVPAWMAIIFYFAMDLIGAVIGMFSEHRQRRGVRRACGRISRRAGLVAFYNWKVRAARGSRRAARTHH